MDRRTFACRVAGVILAAPFATMAQQPIRVWRIGYLRKL